MPPTRATTMESGFTNTLMNPMTASIAHPASQYSQDYASFWREECEERNSTLPLVPAGAQEHQVDSLDDRKGLLLPKVTPTTSHSIPLPPHREWEDLRTVDLPTITSHLHDLTKRCNTTRDAFDNALYHLQMRTQMILTKHSPTFPKEVAEYLYTFTAAQLAGRAIFAPQEAYRSAIATLGMLITDLIDVLPNDSAIKGRMRKMFDESMEGANEKEEGVRRLMRRLADETTKGGESFALAVYMSNARERFKNWSAEEERFKKWAEECVRALL